jgi:threonylcarbamoyladenosine tRNA methylthiotransferase MtaB
VDSSDYNNPVKTFHLTSFGCRASQADGDALKIQLADAGFAEAADAASSDVAVLNTCTVTAAADAEVRQIIRRIHRANPDCRILVTGCYAQRAPKETAGLEGVAWVIGNSHKHRLADILRAEGELWRTQPAREEAPAKGTLEACTTRQPAALSAVTERASSDSGAQVIVGEIDAEFHFAPAVPDDRTRPTLKVQDGCDARCAFCIIPTVRGKSRSLPPDRVVEEVRQLERRGFQEVVLSGINLGSYGRDLNRTIDFLELLERILSETAIPRLRISSIEPMDVSPALIRLAARQKRIAEHFHVPLQSGSDRILRLMNRRYWTSQYAERVLAVREELPHAGIGADVMTGFPGETPEDHRLSAEFIERLPFTYLHVFPYSWRPGTAAAGRAEQVEGRIAHERGRALRVLVAGKRQTFLESQVGRTLSAVTLDRASRAAAPDALSDSAGGDSGAVCARAALSSNYLPLSLDGSDLPANVLVDVEIGRVAGGTLHGYAARP